MTGKICMRAEPASWHGMPCSHLLSWCHHRPDLHESWTSLMSWHAMFTPSLRMSWQTSSAWELNQPHDMACTVHTLPQTMHDNNRTLIIAVWPTQTKGHYSLHPGWLISIGKVFKPAGWVLAVYTSLVNGNGPLYSTEKMSSWRSWCPGTLVPAYTSMSFSPSRSLSIEIYCTYINFQFPSLTLQQGVG